MKKVKARKAPIDPMAKKMKRGSKIFTPDEKRRFAAMSELDRHQTNLDSLAEKKIDMIGVMLLQSARQQEELEAAKKREDALWAMYATCCGYMSKAQRDRHDSILKRIIDRLYKGWVPPCGLMWIAKGQKLKVRVLGKNAAEQDGK